MNKRVTFLFPGQGAQYVGMGKDFADQFPAAKAVFNEADRLLGYAFSDLIFNGPAEELTLTKNSQLAIFIVSCAILSVIKGQFPDIEPAFCAGLSLGEYTALVAAEKISFKECLFLVRDRASFMNEACETHPGSMQVVLGMEPEKVSEVLREHFPLKEVSVANVNCPGQVVIAGAVDPLSRAAQVLKEQGAKRVLPLDVSGAFHSPLMQEAKEKLSLKIYNAALADSSVEVVMNTPGDFVSSLPAMRTFMVEQVTQPVLWEKGIQAMMQRGVDLFLEIGCGKTLQGMN